jgi:NADH-quinone oxidoreductase subunit L
MVGLSRESAGEPHLNYVIAGIGSALALAGIGLAAALYRQGSLISIPDSLRGLYQLSLNKLYIDEIYYGLLVKPAELLAAGCRQMDRVLDGLAMLLAALPKLIGSLMRPLQNGMLQSYSLGMILGLAVFAILVIFRSPTR